MVVIYFLHAYLYLMAIYLLRLEWVFSAVVFRDYMGEKHMRMILIAVAHYDDSR